MKTLACRDFGLDCDFVAKGETMDELKAMAMPHIASTHPEKMEDMKKMTDEQMMAMVKEM